MPSWNICVPWSSSRQWEVIHRSARWFQVREPCAELIRRPQAIADAGLGQYELRPLRIDLDLLAELADIDPQILRIGQLVPELLEQEAMGQHLAGVLHQDAQELIFLRRQFDLALADLHDAAHQVDREIAGAKHRPLAMDLQLMPQRRAQPRQQL